MDLRRHAAREEAAQWVAKLDRGCVGVRAHFCESMADEYSLRGAGLPIAPPGGDTLDLKCSLSRSVCPLASSG